MAEQQTTACPSCGRQDECSLCALLAYGYGPELTPAQQEAVTAYMTAKEGTDGPAYQRMVAAGLPKWGEAHHD